MKKAIHVKIPKPCHEDWAKMTLTQKGRHCASCEKEVTDFTQKSDEQIVKMLTENPNSCGRFKKTQLDREIILERKSTASLAPYAASLLLPLTLLGSLNSKASSKEIKTEKVYKSLGIGRYNEANNPSKGKTLTVGIVTDPHGNVLNNVKITSNETGVVTYTNRKGEYELICFHGETLRFEITNFETFEFVTTGLKNVKNVLLATIALPMESMPLGRIQIAPEKLHEVKGDMIIEEDIKKEEEKPQGIKIISGTVTDSSGLPLPGVNIIVKGTTTGTQSDFDGLYSLEVEGGQTLVFSYVGFNNVQRSVNASSNEMNVTLDESLTGEVAICVITGGYIASEANRVTATKPFGNVSFAYDHERETAKRKQRNAYENGLKFQLRKWREKKEAIKLKRQERKAERAQKKLEKQKLK